MKKLAVLSSLFIASGILMLSSCSKDSSTTGPQGPAGPSYTGSISGHITLYNEYGDVQPANACKSVKITLYNASNAAIDSVNADSTGKYTINSISTGLYTLAFRDTNYGEDMHENFQFLGSSQPLEVDAKLSHLPNFTFTVAGDSIHNKNGDTTIYVYGTVAASAPQARDLIVFIGSSSLVSSVAGTYSSIVGTVTIAAGATTFSTTIQLNSFYLAGFNPGQTAYLNIYSAAVEYSSSSEYENYATGQTTYNALGSSAIANSIKL